MLPRLHACQFRRKHSLRREHSLFLPPFHQLQHELFLAPSAACPCGLTPCITQEHHVREYHQHRERARGTKRASRKRGLQTLKRGLQTLKRVVQGAPAAANAQTATAAVCADTGRDHGLQTLKDTFHKHFSDTRPADTERGLQTLKRGLQTLKRGLQTLKRGLQTLKRGLQTRTTRMPKVSFDTSKTPSWILA